MFINIALTLFPSFFLNSYPFNWYYVKKTNDITHTPSNIENKENISGELKQEKLDLLHLLLTKRVKKQIKIVLWLKVGQDNGSVCYMLAMLLQCWG